MPVGRPQDGQAVGQCHLAAEVGHGHGDGGLAGGKRQACRLECAVAVAQAVRRRRRMLIRAGGDDVQVAVAVQVGHRQPAVDRSDVPIGIGGPEGAVAVAQQQDSVVL